MKRSIIRLLLGAAAAALSVTSALAYDWTISNNSKWAIHRIFISPCRGDTWGPNQLAENEVLSPGESHVFRNLLGSCYAVKLVDEDGDVCVIPLHAGTELTISSEYLSRCESGAP